MELSSIINAKAKSHYVTECSLTKKKLDIVNQSPFYNIWLFYASESTSEYLKFPKFPGGASPQTPLEERWVFGPLHYTNSNYSVPIFGRTGYFFLPTALLPVDNGSLPHELVRSSL